MSRLAIQMIRFQTERDEQCCFFVTRASSYIAICLYVVPKEYANWTDYTSTWHNPLFTNTNTNTITIIIVVCMYHVHPSLILIDYSLQETSYTVYCLLVASAQYDYVDKLEDNLSRLRLKICKYLDNNKVKTMAILACARCLGCVTCYSLIHFHGLSMPSLVEVEAHRYDWY